MATVLALLASLTWGTSDFLGGTIARRRAATAVVAGSQGIALIGVVVVVVATRAWQADPSYVGWAAAAAVFGVVGLTSFYAALAAGTMGVVAPVAALGVAVPVALGVAQGDRPARVQVVGLIVAVAGVVLASGPEWRGGAGRRTLALAGVAAVGFGLVNVFLAHGARSSTTMSLLVMRGTSVSVLVAAAILTRRVDVRVDRADVPALTLVGAGDVGANALFAVASTRGLLSLVSVLSSLYPAVTVLLARLVHAERLRAIQGVGVAAALVGVVLIASGGGAGG